MTATAGPGAPSAGRFPARAKPTEGGRSRCRGSPTAHKPPSPGCGYHRRRRPRTAAAGAGPTIWPGASNTSRRRPKGSRMPSTAGTSSAAGRAPNWAARRPSHRLRNRCGREACARDPRPRPRAAHGRSALPPPTLRPLPGEDVRASSIDAAAAPTATARQRNSPGAPCRSHASGRRAGFHEPPG